MLACELIDNNGKELLKCVNQYIDQWGLEEGFKNYFICHNEVVYENPSPGNKAGVTL